MRLLLLIIVYFFVFSAVAKNEQLIEINVDGVNEQVRQNIKAYLNPLPKSKSQRRAFIFNAKNQIRNAMESLGYYQFRSSTKLIRNEHSPWLFEISIERGSPTLINSVEIEVKGELHNDQKYIHWRSKVKLKPNERLNHGNYIDTKDQLIGLALSHGYFDAKYSTSQIVINRSLKVANIKLILDSGTRYQFGSVNFKGYTLDTNLLSQLTPFSRGDPYTTTSISKLNRELSSSGYFRNIKVIPQLSSTINETIPIKVELQNRPRHSIDLGLGADGGGSTDRNIDPRVRFTWRTPQINKHGHSQETISEWSRDRPKLRTSYTIPLTHPLNDQLKIRFGLFRDKYGVTQVYKPIQREFDTTDKLESEKVLIGVGRQQTLTNGWLRNYSILGMKEKYIQEDVIHSPRYFIFGINYSHTKRGDDTLDPISGFRQTYNFEYADPVFGSSIRLARLQARFKWVFTPIEDHRFVSRLDLGINITKSDKLSKIAPSLRYFAGGDQSIRGYGYQELGPYREYIDSNGDLFRQVIGGRYLAVASIEYQYYLNKNWRLATFVDAGNAYDLSQFKPLVSIGAGIHWISPVGPIKLDLGIGLNETETVARSWRFHLTMGSTL
ncbi:outer membrane protein assembly factor [Parashewanella spongiae]|uniref:Translocation and assembly module subunit TamA n=1 Tax=Parashewanella spongiae TaxID=342950 RepID=A0A3A6TYY0_9GAMM|nr:outer membrane protein assembly factor [Parashewanella spongiae]